MSKSTKKRPWEVMRAMGMLPLFPLDACDVKKQNEKMKNR